MIQVRNACLAFGKQIIFDDISFVIQQTDRIGLVGRNGSGKTTLLKAMQDASVLDEGTVSVQKNKKIAYMPQEVVLQSELSIFYETYRVFEGLYALEQEAAKLERELEHTQEASVVERYAALQEKLFTADPETCKARTKKMLMGLGFKVEQFDQPVESLSVGWKMRIVLGKLLLQEADFYLFDEPTNHLDLIAKEWFLGFLKESSFGFMLICHERYFLQELCNKIVDLERGNAVWYTGNYDAYIMQKEHNAALLQSAYVQQQKDIQRKQAVIAKFKAGTRSTQAKSMEKALDKIERITIPPAPKTVSFSFPPVQQSGKMVIKVENVAQQFGDKIIFEHVSFEINRGEKVAIIAPNGVGKTTLFNVIAGLLPVQKGTVTYGHNVTNTIFAQDQNKVLPLNESIFDAVKDRCPTVPDQKIRSFLGAFLFSGDDVLKKIRVLSGGEKNKVGMVITLLQQTNLLLLDEPTNHLDIPSKDILLKALQEFQGTLLFVSHDRDFINDLATNIIELTKDGAHCYEGNYDSYVSQKESIDAANTSSGEKAATKNKIQPSEHNGDARDVRKEIKKAEDTIAKLEKQIATAQEAFADLTYGEPAFEAGVKKLRKLEQELKLVETEWTELQQKVYSGV